MVGITGRGFDITLEKLVRELLHGMPFPPTPSARVDGDDFFHFTHSVWNIIVNMLLYIDILVIGKATVEMHSSEEESSLELNMTAETLLDDENDDGLSHDLIHQVYSM